MLPIKEDGFSVTARCRRSAVWNYAFIIFLLLNINITSGQILGQADLDAINDIKNSIVPANLWNTSDPDPCAWPGITCTAPSPTRAVYIIDFTSFATGYEIALLPSFSNFSAIRSIYLNNAVLTAPLPNLGVLTMIRFTNVSNIQWTDGPSLTSLTVVLSSMDALPPPSYFPNLKSYSIIFSKTTTSNNPVFSCTANSALGSIQIERASMTSFPDLSNCNSLQVAIFRGLGMTGPIPSLVGLSNVVQLSLGDNQLTGPLPAGLSSLTQLTSLDLSNNQFTGTLDPTLFSRPLQTLNLGGNRLEGTIPDTFQNTWITILNLANNKLNGTIPPSLAAQQPLTSVNLQQNQLSGDIPTFKSPSLTTLLLNNNRFTGILPDNFFNLNIAYSSVDLSNNQLIGSMPMSLYNSTITSLLMANNTFSGCVETGFYVPSKCDLSGNYFCCKSDTPLCPVNINCKTCTTPKPTENATCIVDSDGNPIWLVTGDLIISSNNTNTTIENGYVDGNLITETSITIDGVTVTGNLTVSGDLTVNTGIIKVQGCAFVNGSLTLNLTPEEIEQLNLSGTITRDLIQYDALCGDGSVNFNSIIVNGDVDCTKLVGRQQTSPGLVSIVVTATKVYCSVATPANPSPLLPDWAIGVIVAGAVVIVGVIILAVLLGRKANIKKEEERITLRAASASVTNAPLRA